MLIRLENQHLGVASPKGHHTPPEPRRACSSRSPTTRRRSGPRALLAVRDAERQLGGRKRQPTGFRLQLVTSRPLWAAGLRRAPSAPLSMCRAWTGGFRLGPAKNGGRMPPWYWCSATRLRGAESPLSALASLSVPVVSSEDAFRYTWLRPWLLGPPARHGDGFPGQQPVRSARPLSVGGAAPSKARSPIPGHECGHSPGGTRRRTVR